MTSPVPLIVGSRASKLALVQVEEILEGMSYHYPELTFQIKCGPCKGDLDQKTSLKYLGATDFFTYELDQWLLKGQCRITIHSAKDLPDPLPQGIQIVAITQNQNNQDVLVLRPLQGAKFQPKNLKIGVSSERREEGVSKLFPHATFCDLRGTIEKRLEKVVSGELDGIAIAKVALMRLNLLHLNTVDLPIKPCPLQGSLAVLAREGDGEMEALFSCLDIRQGKKSLFLGLDPSKFLSSGEVIHYPMIKICPRPKSELLKYFFDLCEYTHFLFTSRFSVQIFLECLSRLQKPYAFLNSKKIITVGQSTARLLKTEGIYVDYIPQEESQEGLIALFERLKMRKTDHIFYPKSSRARPLLLDYLEKREINFSAPDFYDTLDYLPETAPNLEEIDEIVFTSPSVIKSFFNQFTLPEKEMRFVFKGKVTKDYFNKIHAVK
jgi:hydroxymethylbilane synthase